MNTLRTLTVRRDLDGPLDALQRRFADDPGVWLPPPARWRGRGRWAVTLTAGPAHRTVVLSTGDVWRLGDAVWRGCSWTPGTEPHDFADAQQWLPRFKGTLGIEPSGGGTRLVLHGWYRPPAGGIGAVADSVVMGRIARRTAGALLDGIAARLADAEAEAAPRADEGSRLPRQASRVASRPRRSAR